MLQSFAGVPGMLPGRGLTGAGFKGLGLGLGVCCLGFFKRCLGFRV